jgi:hypothetical protein
MATQIEKIKEMANKKLLNGDQKRVLYKLFEQKISAKVERAKKTYEHEQDVYKNKLLAAGEKNPAVKKVLTAISKAKADQTAAKQALDKLGFSTDYDGDLTIDYGNPELKKFENENERKISKMENLKLKLLADIHGLPMTYDEMTDYVEKEIAKIEAE